MTRERIHGVEWLMPFVVFMRGENKHMRLETKTFSPYILQGRQLSTTTCRRWVLPAQRSWAETTLMAAGGQWGCCA